MDLLYSHIRSTINRKARFIMSNTYECTCKYSGLSLAVPNTNHIITPGCKVKLGRFKVAIWTVNFGWFSFSGNRPMCGWYMSNDDTGVIKPLLLTDLDDIYMIEH